MLCNRTLFVVFLLISSMRAREPLRFEYRGETSVSPLDQQTMTSNKSIDATTGDMKRDMGKILAKDEELLAVAGAELPDCFRGCNDYFFKTLDVAVKSGNNYERFHNVCHRFIEARDCLEKLKHCGNYEVFDVITSGIKYMCVDQKDAFNATMECIDVNTSEIQDTRKPLKLWFRNLLVEISSEGCSLYQIPVQFVDIKGECSKDCNVEGILAGWGVYAGLRQTALFAQQTGPAKVNVLFFRKLTSEGCQVLQCFLSCLRSKFNTRCHGMAGSLLSEVIFRPIAMGQDLMLLGPALNLVRLILPMQCNFVMTKAGISNFRINSKLDAKLKSVYSSKSGVDIRNILAVNHSIAPEEEQNPWAKGTSEDHSQSPLEEDSIGRKYDAFDF